MNEKWKPVKGYEGYYEVSNLGRIKSLRRKEVRSTRVLKGTVHPDGYRLFKLSKGGSSKSYKGHRLVALAFIPNPENKPMVNHKDGVRDNNCVGNLEWVTNQENITHGYRVLGTTHKKVSYKKGRLKGVCFHKATNKYCAKISWDGKEIHLGVHESKSKAYKVYYSKHLDLHGFEPFNLDLIPED